MALTWTGDLAQRAEDFHDTMLKGDRSEQFEELREFLHTAALAADGPFVPRDLIAEMNQRIWPPARVPRQLIKDACATLNRHGIHYDGVMLHPPGNTASTGTLPESVPTPSPMRAAPRASTSPSIRTQPPIRTAPSLRAPRPLALAPCAYAQISKQQEGRPLLVVPPSSQTYRPEATRPRKPAAGAAGRI